MIRRTHAPNEQAEVRARFFAALDMLKSGEHKAIRGEATFCRRYDINRRTMWTMRNNKDAGILQAAWLVYLVRDYGVSADWLLTGRGMPFAGGFQSGVNCVNNSE